MTDAASLSLRDFVEHRSYCKAWAFISVGSPAHNDNRCTCGLADVLARLPPDKLNEEPHVEALVDRAGEWQSRMFDHEVKGGTPTTFEAEAQRIIEDLMLCVAYSPAARLPVEGETEGLAKEQLRAAFKMADAAEMLWVVLANVSGGDWTKQTLDWQEAAARWRDNYFAALKGEKRDVVCQHGTALDVHCCNCHSGFIFDRDHECPETPSRPAETRWQPSKDGRYFIPIPGKAPCPTCQQPEGVQLHVSVGGYSVGSGFQHKPECPALRCPHGVLWAEDCAVCDMARVEEGY